MMILTCFLHTHGRVDIIQLHIVIVGVRIEGIAVRETNENSLDIRNLCGCALVVAVLLVVNGLGELAKKEEIINDFSINDTTQLYN